MQGTNVQETWSTRSGNPKYSIKQARGGSQGEPLENVKSMKKDSNATCTGSHTHGSKPSQSIICPFGAGTTR